MDRIKCFRAEFELSLRGDTVFIRFFDTLEVYLQTGLDGGTRKYGCLTHKVVMFTDYYTPYSYISAVMHFRTVAYLKAKNAEKSYF